MSAIDNAIKKWCKRTIAAPYASRANDGVEGMIRSAKAGSGRSGISGTCIGKMQSPEMNYTTSGDPVRIPCTVLRKVL
jgi:hypothetical protein